MTAPPTDRQPLTAPFVGVALVALGAASVVALLSFGGQIVLAPVLVPLQWLAVRRSTELVRAVFTVLAALLMMEFFVILSSGVLSNDTAAALTGLGLGGAATYVFYRTSRSGPSLAR